MDGHASIRLLQCCGTTIGAIGIPVFLLFESSTAIYALTIGLAMGEGISAPNWIAVTEYFGQKSYAKLIGFYSAGALGLPVFVGWMDD